ncbi:MAG: hypothetical protein EZS28_012756, partial [Streblomastix strix]
MADLEQGICFSTHENAIVRSFNTTLVIHIVLIAILIIFCLAVSLYFTIKTSNDRGQDADSLAREATIGKFDLQRIIGYIMLIYEGVQLVSVSLMSNGQVTEAESSPMTLPVFDEIFQILQYAALKFTSWIPIILFIVYYFITIFAFLWTIILKHNLPSFLSPIIFDSLYMPQVSAYLQVFACTYTCKYFGQQSGFVPFPSLDMFPSISCNSPIHIIWFILAFFGIMILHPLTTWFVAFEKNKSDPAMRLLPRFNVIFYSMKLIFTLTSVVIKIPLITLPINTAIFFFLFVSHIYLQPCLGFGLHVNNLRSALLFLEFSTSFFSMMAEIVPTTAEIFVIFIITIGIPGFIGVYVCNNFRASKITMPSFPLDQLLQGFDTNTRLKIQVLKKTVAALVDMVAAESGVITNAQHNQALSLLLKASMKIGGPVAMVETGALIELSKLVIRGKLASRKEIKTVVEITSNCGEFDYIDSYPLHAKHAEREINLVQFLAKKTKQRQEEKLKQQKKIEKNAQLGIKMKSDDKNKQAALIQDEGEDEQLYMQMMGVLLKHGKNLMLNDKTVEGLVGWRKKLRNKKQKKKKNGLIGQQQQQQEEDVYEDEDDVDEDNLTKKELKKRNKEKKLKKKKEEKIKKKQLEDQKKEMKKKDEEQRKQQEKEKKKKQIKMQQQNEEGIVSRERTPIGQIDQNGEQIQLDEYGNRIENHPNTAIQLSNNNQSQQSQLGIGFNESKFYKKEQQGLSLVKQQLNKSHNQKQKMLESVQKMEKVAATSVDSSPMLNQLLLTITYWAIHLKGNKATLDMILEQMRKIKKQNEIQKELNINNKRLEQEEEERIKQQQLQQQQQLEQDQNQQQQGQEIEQIEGEQIQEAKPASPVAQNQIPKILSPTIVQNPNAQQQFQKANDNLKQQQEDINKKTTEITFTTDNLLAQISSLLIHNNKSIVGHAMLAVVALELRLRKEEVLKRMKQNVNQAPVIVEQSVEKRKQELKKQQQQFEKEEEKQEKRRQKLEEQNQSDPGQKIDKKKQELLYEFAFASKVTDQGGAEMWWLKEEIQKERNEEKEMEIQKNLQNNNIFEGQSTFIARGGINRSVLQQPQDVHPIPPNAKEFSRAKQTELFVLGKLLYNPDDESEDEKQDDGYKPSNQQQKKPKHKKKKKKKKIIKKKEEVKRENESESEQSNKTEVDNESEIETEKGSDKETDNLTETETVTDISEQVIELEKDLASPVFNKSLQDENDDDYTKADTEREDRDKIRDLNKAYSQIEQEELELEKFRQDLDQQMAMDDDEVMMSTRSKKESIMDKESDEDEDGNKGRDKSDERSADFSSVVSVISNFPLNEEEMIKNAEQEKDIYDQINKMRQQMGIDNPDDGSNQVQGHGQLQSQSRFLEEQKQAEQQRLKTEQEEKRIQDEIDRQMKYMNKQKTQDLNWGDNADQQQEDEDSEEYEIKQRKARSKDQTTNKNNEEDEDGVQKPVLPEKKFRWTRRGPRLNRTNTLDPNQLNKDKS